MSTLYFLYSRHSSCHYRATYIRTFKLHIIWPQFFETKLHSSTEELYPKHGTCTVVNLLFFEINKHEQYLSIGKSLEKTVPDKDMLYISNLEQAYSHTITFVWYRTKKLIFEVYPLVCLYNKRRSVLASSIFNKDNNGYIETKKQTTYIKRIGRRLVILWCTLFPVHFIHELLQNAVIRHKSLLRHPTRYNKCSLDNNKLLSVHASWTMIHSVISALQFPCRSLLLDSQSNASYRNWRYLKTNKQAC